MLCVTLPTVAALAFACAAGSALGACAGAKTIGREARFRLNIVAAYNYTCALTGYRLTTITAGSIVDADVLIRQADAAIKVHFPLVGGRVEKAIVSGLQEHAVDEEKTVNEFLGGH